MTARPQDVALLPCPFCGDTPTMKNIRADENQGTKWGGVVCSCGVVGPEVRTDYMPVDHWGDRAIAAWNTRANVTAALASAQAREEELRVALTLEKAGAEHERIRMTCRIERLEEALRAAWLDLEQGIDQRIVIAAIRAALSTNAATQTGETT